MAKIIGFTISQNEIDHGDIDVFKTGLNLIKIKHCSYFIYLWGIGEIERCKINDSYTLSFPQNENLLDRNVLIKLNKNSITIENDWLGSIPVFYNTKEKIISTLSLKCLKSKEIDHDGLYDFFEFGYSVFEQTPFIDVRFLRYFSKLFISEKGIEISYKDDITLSPEVWNKVSGEKQVFENIKHYINNIEQQTKEEIILPTSGGYDSRLLNICINDKTRVRSFTYGISDNQSESYEVVNAKKVSEILGTKWQQIELTEFFKYIPEWFKIFGYSTHLHGMYHIEFYKKILQQNTFTGHATFLSGIIGDAWSGNVNIKPIETTQDIILLGISHGANADVKQLLTKITFHARKIFLEKHYRYLQSNKLRIIFSMRLKLLLLSYLNSIPEYFGFPVFTPFLNFEIATGMLNLPANRKEKRIWQLDIFKKHGLDLESINLKKEGENTLNFNVYYNFNFEPIQPDLLVNIVKKSYIRKINKIMTQKINPNNIKLYNSLLKIRYIGKAMQYLGFKTKKEKDIIIIFPYCIVKAFELSLKN